MTPQTRSQSHPRPLLEAVKPSAQRLFNEILKRISNVTEFTEIVFEEVSPEDGELICRSLACTPEVERKSAR